MSTQTVKARGVHTHRRSQRLCSGPPVVIATSNPAAHNLDDYDRCGVRNGWK